MPFACEGQYLDQSNHLLYTSRLPARSDVDGLLGDMAIETSVSFEAVPSENGHHAVVGISKEQFLMQSGQDVAIGYVVEHPMTVRICFH